MKKQPWAITLVTLATAAFYGCLGPGRVSAPDWDVESITEACMQQCDEDGDGFLSKSELENAPGLEYAARQLDLDQDNQLSREEVSQRFQDLLDSKVGMQGFTCFVTLNGRPLADGQLRLVPEPFLEGVVPPAEGSVKDPRTGMAEVNTPNDEGLFGVRSGMYRVEITSPSVDIPAKYNTETELGVEVSPFTNPFEDPGGIKFKLRK